MSLVIIHLTDIHIHDERDLILKKANKIAIAICSHIHSSDDVILTVTGDISFSGEQKQYNLAANFFNSIFRFIKDRTGIDSHILFVPGNHDCDLSSGTSVREALINDIQKNRYKEVPEDIKSTLLNAQQNYSAFIRNYDSEDYSFALCGTRTLAVKWGKVIFILYNTAWMSQLHEKEGTLYYPQKEFPVLPDIDNRLVISMAHHPLNWFDSTTADCIRDYIRKNTDIMLWGHEHRRDSANVFTNNWNFTFKNGKELQSEPNKNDSAFAVYYIDDLCQTILTSTYSWNQEKQLYEEESASEPFYRNYSILQREFVPNDETLKMMNDYGTLIRHFSQEQITLRSLFCWPELIAIDDQKENKGYITYNNQEQIIDLVLNNKIILISGGALSGKTALAKMLYQHLVDNGKICVFSQGDNLVVLRDQLDKRIDEIFVEQYSRGLLDKFHQKEKNEKVLIIDDFERIGQSIKTVSDFTSITDQFGHIILLSGSDEYISSMIVNHAFPEEEQIPNYRIRHFGNLKRDELVRRWFKLNNDLIDDSELDMMVENALSIINSLMGGFRAFIPSAPITIVGILQSINAASGNSHLRSSQFGYLYDDLVHNSLRPIAKEEDGTLNIYIAMLSEIAYKMFTSKSYSMSSVDILATITEYAKAKIVSIDVVKAISDLTKANIFQTQTGNEYSFKYPYLFYYFVAQYIAKHIEEKTIKNQISDMSENLHIEAYGNIMIFVCHFSQSKTIIENILIEAYCTFDNKTPVNLANPGIYLSDSYKNNIERILAIKGVGTEKDVTLLRQEDLKEKDRQEESAVIASTDDNWKSDGMGDEVAEIISALKTIDVLGQILKNYPGDIDGDVKNNIILVIDNLSMRVLQAIIDIFSGADEQYIEDCAKRISREDSSLSTVALAQKVQSFFSFLTLNFSNSLISRVAYAIQSKHLIEAASRLISSKQGSLSLEIALWKVKLLCQERPDYDSLIKFNKELKKQKYNIAGYNLRSVVIRHLRHRHVGYKDRDKLCAEFNLEKALTMPNNQ